MLGHVRTRWERGDMKGTAALAERIVRALTKAPDGCATLGWLASRLGRPVVDLAAPLVRLKRAGRIFLWKIHRGGKPVDRGVSLAYDPTASLRGRAWARVVLATDLGCHDHSNVGEFDRHTELPADAPTLAEVPKLHTLEDGREVWLAPEGDFAAIGEKPVIPEWVPYPTLWLGSGVTWGRSKDKTCIGCNDALRMPFRAYCLVCDAYGADYLLFGQPREEAEPDDVVDTTSA